MYAAKLALPLTLGQVLDATRTLVSEAMIVCTSLGSSKDSSQSTAETCPERIDNWCLDEQCVWNGTQCLEQKISTRFGASLRLGGPRQGVLGRHYAS